ncbi:MAG: MFS transporter [Gammaproteobacteria bacterium]|nr:MFS transporter [Gammaproteobacteria bacterium]
MRNPWITRLSILTLVHVVGTLHMVSVMAMAPVIQRDLNLSVTQVGLLVTAYYGAQTVGAFPAGGLVDRLGVGWSLVLAQVILIAGAISLSQANDFAAAFGSCAVMGLGYSLTNPASARGVLEWFPPERRATAMGIKQTGVSIGGVLAAGNGALVTLLSWQSILWIIAGVTAASALVSLRLAERPSWRAGGSFRSVIAHLSEVVRDRNLGLLFAAGGFYNMGQMNFFAYLTLFMREAAQASQPVAGLSLAIAQAASAVGRIGWGVVSDTVFRGKRKTLVVGLCGTAVILLAAMAAVGLWWGVAVGIALALALGLTIASFASLMQTLAVEAVAPRLAGSAMGYSLVGTALGGMVGPPLFGAVVDLTGNFANGWLLTAGLVLAGTLLLGFRFREQRAEQSTR